MPNRVDRPSRARLCICGKHMFERVNDGVCLWCGHGLARTVAEHAYRRNMERVDPELDRQMWSVDAERARREQGRHGGPPKTWTVERCVDAARNWEQIHGHLPSSVEWAAAGDGHPSIRTIIRVFGGMAAFRREIADVPRERLAA